MHGLFVFIVLHIHVLYIGSEVTKDDILSQSKQPTSYKTQQYNTGDSRQCTLKMHVVDPTGRPGFLIPIHGNARIREIV